MVVIQIAGMIARRIVCDVKDAYKCFMSTNLDILVCENFIMYKDQQI